MTRLWPKIKSYVSKTNSKLKKGRSETGTTQRSGFAPIREVPKILQPRESSLGIKKPGIGKSTYASL